MDLTQIEQLTAVVSFVLLVAYVAKLHVDLVLHAIEFVRRVRSIRLTITWRKDHEQ